MENKNKPKIRFKGFEKDWKNLKLAEIGKFIGGGTPSTQKKEFWNGNIPWISSSDLSDESIHKINLTRFITTDAINQSATKIVSKNSILIVSRVGVGKIAVNNYDICTSQDFTNLSLFNDDNIFVAYLLSVKTSKLLELNQGTSIKGFVKSDLETLELLFPEFTEQKLIGNFFKNLDNLITEHQQKHSKLKSLKKAMLDKMFPKQGQLVPEIRFKEFEGAWEKPRLGDIGDPFTGLSGKTKNDFGHGEGRYITYMNVFSNPISDLNMLEKIELDSSQNEVVSGDVLFTVSSETADEVGMSSVWTGNKKNVYLNSFCFGYRAKIKLDNCFLANLLRTQTFRKQMTLLAQGISRYNISKNKVMNLTISLPSYDEQVVIGEYFKNLDLLINRHNQQIIKLSNLKKAFLAKMFV